MKRIVSFFLITMVLVFLSACGETEPASVDEIPSEPSQAELTDQLQNSTTYDIETLMSDNFYLLDTIVADREEANIYATKKFTVDEIVDVVSQTIPPDETSGKKDNQQILNYPNHFVTFKQSEEDNQVTLIEVASETFVRNNYSPNYLNGFFTYLMLDRMLSTNNWGQNRQSQCAGGSCYGGYRTGKTTFGGGVTTNRTNRGLSSIRGGGPSAGK